MREYREKERTNQVERTKAGCIARRRSELVRDEAPTHARSLLPLIEKIIEARDDHPSVGMFLELSSRGDEKSFNFLDSRDESDSGFRFVLKEGDIRELGSVFLLLMYNEISVEVGHHFGELIHSRDEDSALPRYLEE